MKRARATTTSLGTRHAIRPPVNERLLQEITRRIVEAFQPEKIILFGSHAYGQPTTDSDLDLFIVMNSDQRPARRRMAVSSLFEDRFMAMDFIVLTPEEVQKRQSGFDPFLNDIFRRGRVLYARER
jgi:predicted nucleotidyltransferase